MNHTLNTPAVVVSDRRRKGEIAAVVATGLGKFILMDALDLRFLYISLACLGWLGYILYRASQDKDVLVYWGLNRQAFRRTFLEFLPVALGLAGLFVLIGHQLGTHILSWHILPILLIYPLWGIIQQFIMIGIMARNLKDLQRTHLSDKLIILLTALVFAVVHFPYLWLVVATFFLTLTYTFLYLRGRNLVVMGIFHGWMGAVYFYTIMARDPWLEVFGRFFS
ncbi:MAG: CPBP family intramembrane glutamic endopeptidase [Bacteroidota bacterium]